MLGAPGATRIITAVLSVILNHIDFGMPITEAVLAPRFDCQVDTIACQARIPEGVCAEVRKKHPNPANACQPRRVRPGSRHWN